MTKNFKTIVEGALNPDRARRLWTANYFPALPFTPQSFEIGSLLPAMLYMARRGHRRGKGNFAETFGRRDANNKAMAPTLTDVTTGLLDKSGRDLNGFADDYGRAMLADFLLTYCLENKGHELGHLEQVQRVFPTHYLASWLDLPKDVANLRGVPEFLTALLAWQEKEEYLVPGGKSHFPVGGDFKENLLLAQFARHMTIRGPHPADLSSDHFSEGEAGDLGVDELLAVRLAQACGSAPLKFARDRLGTSNIPNRWPIADAVAKLLRGDLATFIEVYGAHIPRQAFLPMLEAGIGLGMTNLLLTTTACLFEWERTGAAPKGQHPWPLFVDCSHGQEVKLRNVSEAAMTECLTRYGRLPVLLMVLRVLDEWIRIHPKFKNDLPSQAPNATLWLNLLGDVYQGRHARAELILERLDEACQSLAEGLDQESEAPDVVQSLKAGNISPALRLAEGLVELMGHKLQGGQFLKALDSSLMINRPNGLSNSRRVSRSEAGTRKAVDMRSIVLSHAHLDFLVHRHLRKNSTGKAAKPLTLRKFLDLLRNHYGLYVDREPPGLSVPQELLRANKEWLERRLRDLGLLVGVNDAESMKQLRPRFEVPEYIEEVSHGSA
jgi:hypothetical protein